MTPLEKARIVDRVKDVGYLGKDGTCPLLDKKAGVCTVYHIRPLACHLFGAVKKMACPWGCVPEAWLEDQDFDALGSAIMISDLHHGGETVLLADLKGEN